jgi:predicted amidophosphoribosyltransferase
MVADCADRRLVGAPVALIPVPNSRCSIGASEPPRTRALAEALAVELNGGTGGTDAVVLDVLRWSEPVQPAHLLRGTRNPQELFGRLTIVGSLEALTDRRGVLVDDVLTTGGHLQACAARILRQGHRIDVAVVAGRADQAQVEEPFTIRIDEIAEFAPEAS